MPTYKLKIGGESFRVKADSPEELPSIADYLAEQYGLKPDAEQAAPSAEAPTPAPEQPVGLPSEASEEAMIGRPDGETTMGGLAGAALRGAAMPAVGAGAGAALGGAVGMLGGPAGVGVGARLGARVGAAMSPIADPVVAGVNKLFGTNYSLPGEAVQHYLTQMGVPQADTAAERIVESISGGVASGLGMNALAREVAKRATAGSLMQRAASAMSTTAGEAAATGAAGGAASQTVQEMGGGPALQFGAGLAGGVLASRGFRPSLPSSRIEDDVAKAVKGDKTARSALAEAGAADPKVRQAAIDLGLNVDEIPEAYLSSNPQFQAVSAAVASAPGSKLSIQKQDALDALKTRAQAVIDDAGGTTDLSQLSAGVSERMASLSAKLESAANNIYDVELPKVLPPETPVRIDNALAAVKAKLAELGGDSSRLKKIERQILELEGSTRLPNKEEIAAINAQIIPLKAKVAAGDRSQAILDSIDALEASKTTPVSNPPTYETLKREKNALFKKVKNPDSPIEGLNDLDSGLAERYYGLISSDIDAAATAVGAENLVKEANSLWSQFKDIAKARENLFGQQLQKSLGAPLIDATRKLANKGGYAEYAALLNKVPADARQEVAVSSLGAAFSQQAKEEGFNPAYFKKWYDGLQTNKASKNVLFTNLPPETRKHLDNLYTIASNIQDVKSKDIPTGRLQTAMKASETMMERVYEAVLRTAKGSAAAAVATPVVGPTIGASIAGAIAASGSKEAVPLLNLADGFLLSPEFRALVKASTADPAKYTQAATTAVKSSMFKKFADAVNLPQAQRNAAFLIGTAEEPAQEPVQPEE